MIVTSLATLDKEKVALILDLLYASELSFVLKDESFATTGGEEYAVDTGFFLLDPKPALKQGTFHFELYLMDKDLRRQSKDETYVTLSRKKLIIQAKYENDCWLVDNFSVVKLPKVEKRVFKTVNPLLEGDLGQQMQKDLKREARLIQSVRGEPADPRIISIGEISFFTAKKHPGRNVGQFLNNPKYHSLLNIKNLVDWSIAICQDLQTHFHNKGLLHRDIKLQNIVLNPHNTHEAQLIDLEYVLKEAQESFRLVGTPAYIAPEIYRVNQKNTRSGTQGIEPLPYSRKSDIFALALTISEFFGNTTIKALYQAAGNDQVQVILKTMEMHREKQVEKKFQNLFIVKEQDIFKDYPNLQNIQKIKDILTNLFMKMSQDKAEKRPTIETVIGTLMVIKERIKRDYSKQAKASSAEKQEPDAETPSSSI